MKYFQWAAWWLVAIVVAAVLWRTALTPASHDSAASDHTTGGVTIGGDFSLIDQNNRPVTQADFRGKWMLVYFGFTHCPDICPTGLLAMAQALDQLGKTGNVITPIFITLDPARDVPAAMKDYAAQFSPRLVALTGSMAAIDAAAGMYKVYYSKQDMPNSELSYTINHSGYMYLMGPDGQYRAHFPHNIAVADLVAALRKQLSAEGK